MRTDRHRRGGRHERQYRGWGPSLDEADQLALAQSGDTPPMGFPTPVFQPPPPVYVPAPIYPRPGLSQTTKWVIAAGMAFCAMAFGALLLLAAALVAGPPPAQATTPIERAPMRQTVVVDGDQIKVKARELCPTEDACDIDYEGRGVWTITRRTP